MAKFECPSCGYLLVDVRSCSECGKSVEQSAKEWRERRAAELHGMVAITGMAFFLCNLLWPIVFWFLWLFSLGEVTSFVFGIVATLVVQAWPAWCVARAGIDGQPTWKVMLGIPLITLISFVNTAVFGFFWYWLVNYVVESLFSLWFGEFRFSTESLSHRLGHQAVIILGCFVPMMCLTYVLGRTAARILTRFTRPAHPWLALDHNEPAGRFTPAFPAAAGAEQPKPSESGDSA